MLDNMAVIDENTMKEFGITAYGQNEGAPRWYEFTLENVLGSKLYEWDEETYGAYDYCFEINNDEKVDGQDPLYTNVHYIASKHVRY